MSECNCKTCQLCRAMKAIREKCTPNEHEALKELWGRMEAAETDLEWLALQARGDKVIKLGERFYSVKEIENPFQ